MDMQSRPPPAVMSQSTMKESIQQKDTTDAVSIGPITVRPTNEKVSHCSRSKSLRRIQ